MNLFQQNKLTEAIAQAENIVSIESETLGAVHDDVGATLRLLVLLHGASGNRDATRRARQNVLDFMMVKYGAHDWRFQHEQREVAANEQKADLPLEKQPPPAQAREPAPTERAYYHLDHSEEAAVLLDAATSRYRPLVSKSPRDRADLLSDLALLLLGQTDATLRPEKSVEVAKPEQSASHSDHAAALIDLARMAFERGDHRAARPLYEKAIQITARRERHFTPTFTASWSHWRGCSKRRATMPPPGSTRAGRRDRQAPVLGAEPRLRRDSDRPGRHSDQVG